MRTRYKLPVIASFRSRVGPREHCINAELESNNLCKYSQLVVVGGRLSGLQAVVKINFSVDYIHFWLR